VPWVTVPPDLIEQIVAVLVSRRFQGSASYVSSAPRTASHSARSISL